MAAAARAESQEFLSTLSLRRATLGLPVSQQGSGISIHALLAESDPSSHSFTARAGEFLSTLSLRRATSQQPRGTTRTTYFYPRSPCGERQDADNGSNGNLHFYPRSPCGERRIKPIFGKIDTNFYPRSPCGERRTQSASLSL